MTDADAYMQLVLDSAQGELHPLEEGEHGEETGLGCAEYARRIGKNEQYVRTRILAARTLCIILKDQSYGWTPNVFKRYWRQLYEIYTIYKWLLNPFAKHLIDNEWTVTQTRKEIERSKKDLPEPPAKTP